MSIQAEGAERPARSRLTVWREIGPDHQRVEATEPVALQPSVPHVVEITATAVFPSTGVLVAPIAPLAGAVGVLFHRNTTAGVVSRNGVPVGPGMHLLRHSDRLDVAGQRFWISVAPSVEIAAYDPAVHGVDVFCYLTKARLKPGQQIKICPGMPGQSCGAIYKAEAWEMAMQSEPPMPCASCGYHTRAAEWQPPKGKPHASLTDRLRDLFDF
jgi:hypothetical protein